MGKVSVLVASVLLAGVLATATPAKAAAVNPDVYAHRGGAGYAPENTLGAFRKTENIYGNRGVWLEMDTQATKDGVLVVMHDDSVDRTTNCTGKVNELTLGQLHNCNAAAHYAGWPVVEPIPTLAQVLVEARTKGWKLMVEIKDIPLEANFDATGAIVAKKLVTLLYQTNFPLDDFKVQSFWPAVLDNMRRLSKRIGRVLLTSSTLPSLPVGIPALGNLVYCVAGNHQISAPDFVSIGFNKQFVSIAHKLGRQVVPWTVDTKLQMAQYRGWGVDGIITNRPDLAYAVYA